jgi:flagellar motility protein MotE (MotC chaperone)
MKKLIVPLAIALVSGIAGGTGLTVLRMPKAVPVDSAALALEKADAEQQQSDSTSAEATDSVRADQYATDSLMTPAESLRAVAAAKPLATQAASRGLRDAVRDTSAAVDPRSTEGSVETPAKGDAKSEVADKDKDKDNAASLGNAVEAVRNARNSALATALPEERLAKIFSAMQAKDAARVLDQMEDRDIRAVLSLMGDRQVAAILSALPAPRAATITRGAVKASGADK